ncbi:phage tail protein [Pseudomonas aeruginosa]|nr:phage tail protein [Pseudomonas aeruginosa]
MLADQALGKFIIADSGGLPVAVSQAATAAALCQRIDTAADRARRAVAGDPLRAVEYDRARLAAEQFAAAGYQGEVPAMVAAWAINGRTPQQAADSILTEAAAYTSALELLRTTRLAAKEQVRALMAGNQVEQAQQLTEQTVAAIEAAVAGIGNNA